MDYTENLPAKRVGQNPLDPTRQLGIVGQFCAETQCFRFKVLPVAPTFSRQRREKVEQVSQEQVNR
jgi:hypothetical protein